MKRQIKFRAFVPGEGMMSTAQLLELGINPMMDEVKVDNKEIIFMQFTGLKDKNGVDIYEGDLVRIETEDGEYILPKGENEVKLIDGNWNPYVELGEYWYTLGQLNNQDVRVEVIGNIYE